MNINFCFSWDFRNFAIETNYNKDGSINKRYPLNLIKYDDNSHTTNFVVARWKKDSDGYALEFIGNRPFKEITPEDIASIWVQLQAAQKMLDEYFEACENEERLECW